MGNSSLLEEILHEAHELMIIDEVREVASRLIKTTHKYSISEAYHDALYIVMKDKEKNPQ